MCHENEEWCKNWREIDLLFYNLYEEFDEFLPEHSKVSNIYTLMGPFLSKYIMFELEKYRGIIFHDNEYWCNIWRKIDLYFQKWHEEFGNQINQRQYENFILPWK